MFMTMNWPIDMNGVLSTPSEAQRQLGEKANATCLYHGYKRVTFGGKSDISAATIRSFEQTGKVELEALPVSHLRSMKSVSCMGCLNCRKYCHCRRPRSLISHCHIWVPCERTRCLYNGKRGHAQLFGISVRDYQKQGDSELCGIN